MTTTVLSGHRRRPRLRLSTRVLSRARRRLVSISVAVHAALAAVLAVGAFLPAHLVYESRAFEGLGSFFIGTCSGAGYIPSSEPSSAPSLLGQHTLMDHDGVFFLLIVAVAGVLGWLLWRRRSWNGDFGIATVTLGASLCGGFVMVTSALDHLFSRTTSLIGEHVVALALFGLFGAAIVHAIGVVVLYRRQRRDDERARPVPLAWTRG